MVASSGTSTHEKTMPLIMVPYGNGFAPNIYIYNFSLDSVPEELCKSPKARLMRATIKAHHCFF